MASEKGKDAEMAVWRAEGAQNRKKIKDSAHPWPLKKARMLRWLSGELKVRRIERKSRNLRILGLWEGQGC